MNPFIIAEAGNNHNGDLGTAKKLVDVAKAAGCDTVKFQIIDPEGLYLPVLAEPPYDQANPVLEQRRKSMLSDADYRELARYCEKAGILFGASVFDARGVDLLVSLGASYIKIASCDLNNLSFLGYVAKKKKKIILSTGMSEFEEIKKTVMFLEKNNVKDLVLLHCVSVYPSSLGISRISFISRLKSSFHHEVGFSDHSPESLASVMALGLGATYFEKHFTLDKKQEGFDHHYALEPGELKKYVLDLKEAWKACDEAGPKLTEQELQVKRRARRGLYAARNMEANELITETDLLVVRPESLCSADEYGEILGKRLMESIRKFAPFKKTSVF